MTNNPQTTDMKPMRIQRPRIKGWRVPENAVFVGSGSGWGNPWHAGMIIGGKEIGANDAVDLFRAAVLNSTPGPQFHKRDLWKLRGKYLVCRCPLNTMCHADVLIELANKETIDGEAVK